MKKLLFLILLILVSCTNDNNSNTVNNSDYENKNVILTLWDSLTAWYNLSLDKSYPMQLEEILSSNWYSYEVVNAWVSADTSLQLLNRLDLYLSDSDFLPKVAILVIWWNDWLRWKSVEELKYNIDKIIKRLKEKNIKIVLWWMKIPPTLWIIYSNNFRKIYKELANDNDVYFIEFFLEWVAWVRSLNLWDWIHPNEKWYNIISNNVLDFLIDNELIKND